ASVAAASLADKTALIRATEAFEAVLSRHARAVEAARVISEGLVRTIAAEVNEQRGSPTAYGASGKANAGDGRAVAFNRQA
ncbi:MAG: flagellar basal-body protein FlbY, partial [Alphaproteobacteria bacterium]